MVRKNCLQHDSTHPWLILTQKLIPLGPIHSLIEMPRANTALAYQAGALEQPLKERKLNFSPK